ncbi:MAG: GSCFA domain-containing protein [Pseudomonadota bacterium]
MTLEKLNSLEALQTRRNNPVANWGMRSEENRVEPIARPAFEVPFRLEPGEPIFTIGSCFARHIEKGLSDRGFRIPMRELFETEAFAGVDPLVVNNFGSPSIYNEIAWAFGEQSFDEELGFVELAPDKFVDLHMVNSLRAAPFDLVRARREGLKKATKTISDCRVLIMTLGLTELWWDEAAQTYLNTTPLPSVIKRWPDRFSFHVLDFQECADYLIEAFKIIFANARPDFQVLLTVSPVPMAATHRHLDVITANCYSKSLLRTVAEHVVSRFDNVTYFPSYETVTLSDRRISWADDLVHVNREMVEFNVQRMVEAFTGASGSDAEATLPAPEIDKEPVEALLLAEEARRARVNADADFFARHAGAEKNSPAYAREFARFLIDEGKPSQAAEILEGDERYESIILRASALLEIGQASAATEVLLPLCSVSHKNPKHWRLLLDAYVAEKKAGAIQALETEWIERHPRMAENVYWYCGRALASIGEFDLGRERLDRVIELQEVVNPATLLEYASTLIASGAKAQAKEIIDEVQPQTDAQARRVRVLRRATAK